MMGESVEGSAGSLMGTGEALAWLSSWRGGQCVVCSGCLAALPSGAKKCLKCRMVGYCGRDCQALDWADGGHRRECTFFRKLNSTTATALLSQPRLRLIARLFTRLYPDPKAVDKSTDKDASDKPQEEVGKAGAVVEEEGEGEKLSELRATVARLEDAGDWWGPGGRWTEDDGTEWREALEVNWELFVEIYLHNSPFFRAVVKRVEFETLLGKVVAGTLPIMDAKELGYQETGHALFPAADGLRHACHRPHLRFTTQKRTLRLVYAEGMAEEAKALLAEGRRSELTLCRLPVLRSPLHMRATDRAHAVRNLLARRCDCELCGREGEDDEWALRKLCGDCGRALVYDPSRDGPKVALCRACGPRGALSAEETARLKTVVGKVRKALAVLDGEALLRSVLELRAEAQPLLHPSANLLCVQLNLLAFHRLAGIVGRADEEPELLKALTSFGGSVWEALEEWGGASVDQAVLAALLCHTQLKADAPLIARTWLRRALDVWERLDKGHPTARSLRRRLNDQLRPKPTPQPKDPAKDKPKNEKTAQAPEKKAPKAAGKAVPPKQSPKDEIAQEIMGELLEDENILNIQIDDIDIADLSGA